MARTCVYSRANMRCWMLVPLLSNAGAAPRPSTDGPTGAHALGRYRYESSTTADERRTNCAVRPNVPLEPRSSFGFSSSPKFHTFRSSSTSSINCCSWAFELIRTSCCSLGLDEVDGQVDVGHSMLLGLSLARPACSFHRSVVYLYFMSSAVDAQRRYVTGILSRHVATSLLSAMDDGRPCPR